MKFSLTLFTLSLFSTILSQAQGFDALRTKQFKQVHALVIGVSDYENIQSLEYAHADARLFYRVLNETFPGNESHFDSLINTKASQLNIVNGIRKLVGNAKEGDLVIFYFSGHGDVVDDIVDGTKGYFLAHDASESRVYYPAGGAVEFEFINKALTRITDNKAEVWMITDACKSGKVVDEKGAGSTMTSLNEGFKNTVKFVSCASHELSYEDPNLEQGVFTYYLVRALGGEADTDDAVGVLNGDEISSYLKSSVRTFTKQKQTPRVYTANEFENIIRTNENFSSLIKATADGQSMNDLAMRGVGAKGDGDPKSDKVKRFEALLANGKLHTGSDAALQVIKNNSFGASPTEIALFKDLLTEELLNRGQRTMNLFLSGKPMLGQHEDFATAQLDYTYALELLGKDHPMYAQIESRKQFFKAMEGVQSKQNLESAETILNELATKYPDAAHIHQGLALLYIQKSDKEKAENALNTAKEKVPTWSKPQNSSTLLAILSGQLNQAEKLLQESKDLKYNEGNNLLLKAYMHQANYELQLAEKALREIASDEKSISSSEIKAMEAKTNELRGRIQLAQQQYTSALSEDQNNLELILQLAKLYKDERDTAKALNYYQRAKAISPNDPLISASINLLKRKDVNFTIQTIDASDLNRVLQSVSILDQQKKYSEAVTLLTKSIDLIQWNPDLYYELGKTEFALGNESKSIEALKKALEISPYHFKSIRSLAYIYLHAKKFNEAGALISKHEPYFDQSAKYLSLSFQVYRQMNAKRDLYIILEKALQLDSLETDAYRALYQLNIENGMYKEAKMEFTKLMELGGSYTDSIDFYNRLATEVKSRLEQHYYQGQLDGSRLLYELDPLNFEFAYYYGLCSYMEMNYEEANTALRNFGKAIQTFTPGVQRAYYNLKAKINLETDHPDLAERLFATGGDNINPADYLGLAMAQFDQGKDWYPNFRRAGEPLGYNKDALNRYEKMRKKAAKMGGPGGGTERNYR